MEMRRSACGICSRRCVVDLCIEDGEIVAVRPVKEEGFENCSNMCVKGALGGAYRNRADRMTTPLRRVGEKGEGRFEAISWEEAFKEIAEKLLAIRDENGADSVAFFSGYTKWYRPMLRRLATLFGSVNYATESSSCHRAAIIGNICDTGMQSSPDYTNAGVLLATARGRLLPPAKAAAKRGMKIVAIDPYLSPDIEKYADIHLRLRPGTDVALAYGLARELILMGKADEEYIEEHVHGYEHYKARAMEFTPEKVEEICGIEAEKLKKAARFIADNLPMSLLEGFTGLIHHRNGVSAIRAWSALCAICGCYGRKGGNLPKGILRSNGHIETPFRNFEMAHPVELPTDKRIGAEKFPLWNALLDECQAMEFPTAVERGELKAIFALGMNARMFPNSEGMFETLRKTEFFVDCDIWLSDSAKYADIVLPVSVSYEREQLTEVCMDSKLLWVDAAIASVGESKSDEEIILGLAKALGIEDELFRGGADACRSFLLEGTGISLEQLRREKKPAAIPHFAPPKPLENGFPTPSGKYELWSETIAIHSDLDPLPAYLDPLEGCDREAFPLILQAGVRTDRYAHAFHSRTHTVEDIRALRSVAAVDMHPEDAEALGLEKGERVKLETAFGSITVAVDIDSRLLKGCVNMYHGYSEADVNSLFPSDWLDSYSGFPGYKAIACRVLKG